MKNVNVNVLSGAATGSINGPVIDASQIYEASFQSVAGDGAVAGTIQIQMSNDLAPAGTYTAFTPANWTNFPGTSSATISAGASTAILLPAVSARWLRVVFTRTAGTTTINVNMFAICV
jgi:hypothetical protein